MGSELARDSCSVPAVLVPPYSRDILILLTLVHFAYCSPRFVHNKRKCFTVSSLIYMLLAREREIHYKQESSIS